MSKKPVLPEHMENFLIDSIKEFARLWKEDAKQQAILNGIAMVDYIAAEFKLQRDKIDDIVSDNIGMVNDMPDELHDKIKDSVNDKKRLSNILRATAMATQIKIR